MEIHFFEMDTNIFTWVILPLLIFLSRIADQTIGTLRLIFLAKGYKILAPVLGFFEVIIWVLAISQIIQHLNNVMCYVAYGAGFATGNYIGIILAEKLSLGHVLVRIIPKKDTSLLRDFLEKHNYGHTLVDAEGARGPVKIIFTVTKRKYLKELLKAINKFNPHAFYTIEEVSSISEGVVRSTSRTSIFSSWIYHLRKIK